MKKNIYQLMLFFFGLLAFSCEYANAQSVGIGSNSFTPDTKSILEIQGTGLGMLIPRMTWANRPAGLGASQDGLVIYSTDGDGTNGKGFYYYDGSAWQKLFAVSGNYIQNQNSTDQTANFRITGDGILGSDLYVSGGDIFGPGIIYGSNGIVRIHSNTSLRLNIDNDNNGSEQFEICNHNTTTPFFQVTEAGNLTTNGFGRFGGYGYFPGDIWAAGDDRCIRSGNNLKIKSNSGVIIDIDNNANGTSSAFTVQKDSTYALFTVYENNQTFFYPFGTVGGNTGGVKFLELVANGSNWAGLRAPDDLGSDYMLTLPTTIGTSGQVLGNNGSGLLAWQTPITGSGTNNYAAYWNGPSSLAAEQYLSYTRGGTSTGATPTNGGIAYGTGTAYAFTAVGTAGQILTSNGAAAPTWTNATNYAWGLLGNTGTSVATNFIGTTDNVGLVFRTNGFERMRLQNDGQLTIGHTAAGGKLDVHQTSGNDVLILTTYGNANEIKFRGANGSPGSPSLVTTPGSIFGRIIGQIHDGTAYRNSAAITMRLDETASGGDAPGGILFSTTSDGTTTLSDRMYIDNAGLVGIGTTDPQYDLHVSRSDDAEIWAQSTSGNTMMVLEKPSSGDNFLAYQTTGVNDYWQIGTFGTNTNLKINYTLLTYSVFDINSNGRVGIAKDNPGEQQLFVEQRSTNNGTDYASSTVNAVYGYGGKTQYSFGVTGLRAGTSTRSGGVHGAVTSTSWGALGYYSSGSTSYGGYFTSHADGTGFMPESNVSGIGSGSYGGLMGSWSRGEVFGFTAMGELYASYNLGNEYTSGVSADIVTSGNERLTAYSVTSNEVKVYGDGKSKLVNGSCKVLFDKSFSSLISPEKLPTITVSALGECKGVYIVSIDKDGFTVKEFQNGNSNVEFTWIAVGHRVDASQVSRVPDVIKQNDFDQNLKGVMFNEGNTQKSAKPVMWDGKKIVFDKTSTRQNEGFRK